MNERRNFLVAAAAGAGMAVGLVPKTARAGHHRGHVHEFLDAIEQKLALNPFYQFWETLSTVEQSEPFRNASHRYIGDAQTAFFIQIPQVRSILDNGSPQDLFTARRIINQPRFEMGLEFFLEEAWSVHSANMINSMRFFSDVVGPHNWSWHSIALDHMKQIWNSVQHAEWHICDAIFEEVCELPEFGP